jgi:hypothetical protein
MRFIRILTAINDSYLRLRLATNFFRPPFFRPAALQKEGGV